MDVVNGHQRVVDHFTIPKMIEKQEEHYVKLMEVNMIQIVIGGCKIVPLYSVQLQSYSCCA